MPGRGHRRLARQNLSPPCGINGIDQGFRSPVSRTGNRPAKPAVCDDNVRSLSSTLEDCPRCPSSAGFGPLGFKATSKFNLVRSGGSCGFGLFGATPLTVTHPLISLWNGGCATDPAPVGRHPGIKTTFASSPAPSVCLPALGLQGAKWLPTVLSFR